MVTTTQYQYGSTIGHTPSLTIPPQYPYYLVSALFPYHDNVSDIHLLPTVHRSRPWVCASSSRPPMRLIMLWMRSGRSWQMPIPPIHTSPWSKKQVSLLVVHRSSSKMYILDANDLLCTCCSKRGLPCVFELKCRLSSYVLVQHLNSFIIESSKVLTPLPLW